MSKHLLLQGGLDRNSVWGWSKTGPPSKANLYRNGGLHRLEPLVFSRPNTKIGTPALVYKDRYQPESKLIVSFTVLHIQYVLFPTLEETGYRAAVD